MRTKACPKCGMEKVTADFNRNRTKPDGLSRECRECRAKYHLDNGRGRKEWERIKASPELRARQAASQRRTRLKNRYGLTEADFDRMVKSQDGRCALCLRDPGYRLFVDHCHSTGMVRGLLCSKCNGALGWFENNRGRITEYLDWVPEAQTIMAAWGDDIEGDHESVC